jgi:hypothetical protein
MAYGVSVGNEDIEEELGIINWCVCNKGNRNHVHMAKNSEELLRTESPTCCININRRIEVVRDV